MCLTCLIHALYSSSIRLMNKRRNYERTQTKMWFFFVKPHIINLLFLSAFSLHPQTVMSEGTFHPLTTSSYSCSFSFLTSQRLPEGVCFGRPLFVWPRSSLSHRLFACCFSFDLLSVVKTEATTFSFPFSMTIEKFVKNLTQIKICEFVALCCSLLLLFYICYEGIVGPASTWALNII